MVVLLFTYKDQWDYFTKKSTPAENVLVHVIEDKLLEKGTGLSFVRKIGLKKRNAYEFLYSRKNRVEEIINRSTAILINNGLEIGKVRIGRNSGDVFIEIVSKETIFAEIILTPDMSTYTGKICIIIDDMGYNINDVVKKFLNLDIPLTFAVLPGHAYSKRIATLIDKEGFEVIVHMPMDSKDHRSGEEEFLIKRGMRKGEIRSRLRSALLELPQAKGMNNHQGSDATEDKNVMRIVAEVLRSEGKFFIDSKTSAKTVSIEEMERAGVPVAVRAVFIDYKDVEDVVYDQLMLLAEKARKNGIAIGIAHPRKNTLDVLMKEIPILNSLGFKFIFASESVH